MHGSLLGMHDLAERLGRTVMGKVGDEAVIALAQPNCLKGSVYPKIGEKDEDGGTHRKRAI
jgi:hypothetical protein